MSALCERCMEVVLPSGSCLSKGCGEPGKEDASDEAGLRGALRGCPMMGLKGKTSAFPGPNVKPSSPAPLKFWLAQIALYPSHLPGALGRDGLSWPPFFFDTSLGLILENRDQICLRLRRT